MNNQPQIHGHDVLDFMIASGATYTRASLATAIVEKFGAEARFHTCSAAGLSAGELVALLASKGKFRGSESGFTVALDRVCQH
jgi:probable metal-binding protein